MIIIMKPGASKDSVQYIASYIQEKGLQAHVSTGSEVTIIGVVGDKTRIQGDNLEIFEGVERVVAVTESYKLSNRKFHPEPSTIRVGSYEIGPRTLTIMAGPCAMKAEISSCKRRAAYARRARPWFAAAPISPALRRIRFRGWKKKVCNT